VQRPATACGAGLGPLIQGPRLGPPTKNATGPCLVAFFLCSPGSRRCNLYLVPPLAGVPGAVEPEFETAALASGVGMGLVPLVLLELDEPVDPVEGVEDVDGVDGVEELEELEPGEEVAPVSSTFFPQAPKASRAAKARAVAAAGFNWDACMSVPSLKRGEDGRSICRSAELAERQPDINLAVRYGYAP